MSEQIVHYGKPVYKTPKYQYIIWYNTGCESTLEYSSKVNAEKCMLGYVNDLNANGHSVSHISLIISNDESYEVQIT